MDENTCAWAAAGGHLDCLIYARDNGNRWDKQTTFYDANNGHLNCLIYAHEK
jgi:hypothetical protein